MLPTPSTSHVSFHHIYEPAEDSFLLLDTLSSHAEINFLKSRFGSAGHHTDGSRTGIKTDPTRGKRSSVACPLILEVGTGSGAVLAFMTAQAEIIFGRTDVLTVGTDINRYACQATLQTVITALDEKKDTEDDTSRRDAKSQRTSSIFLDPLLADLASPLRVGVVDVLIFNPPYVPTEDLPKPPYHTKSSWSQATDDGKGLEENSYLLSLSYAGGFEGMEITDRLLRQIPDLLSWPQGVAYIVLCAQNRPEVVKERVRAWSGNWHAETVGHTGQKGGWEKLQVIRIWRGREASATQLVSEGQQVAS